VIACRKHQLAEGAIAGIATINIKADEVGILNCAAIANYLYKPFPELLRTRLRPQPSNNS